METDVVVLYADRQPMEGVADPGPHQIYRNPAVCVENRRIDRLHPEEIRVEMLYAGLCGTDIHLTAKDSATGYIKSSAPAFIPEEGRIIGHEGVGRVMAVGANVKNVRPGAFVTFESIIVCHYCDVCRRGQFNQCRHAVLLGLEKDGLFGAVVDLPAMLAHDVSPLIKSDDDLMACACVEPAGVAYVACRNTCVAAGDSVVVFGAGPIGLYSAILCDTVFGAADVHMVEPVAFRREFAAQWVDKVYDVDDFFDNFSGNADVIIEASGDLKNVSKVFRRINANGRIALLARSGEPVVLDAVDHMITNAVMMIGSRGHLCGAFSNILNLYKKGRIPLAQIVTSVVDGCGELSELLVSSSDVLDKNCKVLARFNSGVKSA